MGDVVISRSRPNKVKLLTDLEKEESDNELTDSDKQDSESVVFTDDDDELTISMAGLVVDRKESKNRGSGFSDSSISGEGSRK